MLELVFSSVAETTDKHSKNNKTENTINNLFLIKHLISLYNNKIKLTMFLLINKFNCIIFKKTLTK